MLVLQPGDTLRIVTGAAADIEVYASYIDAPYPAVAGSSVSVDRVVLASITTATTTNVVGAPAAATRRNVKHLNITNNHATASAQVGVEITDGANVVELREVTLMPGENLVMTDGPTWYHRDAQNAEYSYQVPAQANLGPASTLAETMPRNFGTTNSTIGASGTLFMQAIYLTAGQLVTNITMFSGATAAATTSNLFFALYDGNRSLVAQSANQGAYVWASNTSKTLAMTAPYRVPVSGVYYVAVLQVATTIATIIGGAAKTNSAIAAAPPILHGNSSSGLTNALPNPAGAITAGTASLYASAS